MHLFGKTTKTVLAALAIAASVAGITGCSAKPIEATGSSNSKLLAPKAVYKALASEQTQQTLGISEWRVYRGKSSFILTGYDAAGKAMRGVSVSFDGKTSASKPMVRAKMLDGTRFAAHHEYGGGSKASALLKTSSKAFLARAMNDMSSLKQQLRSGSRKTRLGAACSADMTATMAAALKCLSAAGTSTATPDKAAVLACIMAAVSAAASSTSCQDTGTTGSTGAADPKAPASSTSKDPATDSQKDADQKQDQEQDKADDQKDADKAQDQEQDKADDQKDADKAQDTAQDAEDAKKDDPRSPAPPVSGSSHRHIGVV